MPGPGQALARAEGSPKSFIFPFFLSVSLFAVSGPRPKETKGKEKPTKDLRLAGQSPSLPRGVGAKLKIICLPHLELASEDLVFFFFGKSSELEVGKPIKILNLRPRGLEASNCGRLFSLLQILWPKARLRRKEI